MGMSNRQILEKADTVVNDLITGGGYMVPEQARKFLRIMIESSVLLPQTTVVGMKRPKMLIDKIRFANRILRPGVESQALPVAQRAKPEFSQVELDTVLIKGEVRLSSETLEDNIEEEGFKDTMLALIGERATLDIEDLAINGDTGSSDAYLALLDGVRKQITSNVLTVAPKAAISKTHLKGMKKLMPNEFLRNERAMRYFTSIDAVTDYRDVLADRATAVGDKFLEGTAPVLYQGIPMGAVPRFPENLGAGTDETQIILLDPKNIYVGFWRKITIETDKDISAGQLIIVVTLRMDVKLAHEPATVKATGIEVA